MSDQADNPAESKRISRRVVAGANPGPEERPHPAAGAPPTWKWELAGLGLVLAGAALVLLILALLVRSRSAGLAEKSRQDESHKTVAPVPVEVQELKPTVFAEHIRLPGMVSAWQTVDLAAQVAGKVTKLPVEEGQTVKAGETLCLIEDRDYRIALDRARAAHDLAGKTLARSRRLQAADARTQAQLDADEAAFAEAAANLATAELNLERCTIASPGAGVLEKRQPEVGMLLAVGSPVARLLDLAKVKVEIGIPEQDVDALRNLESCEVTVESLDGGRHFAGRRIFLGHEFTAGARVYLLRLAVDNPDGRLRPGMFVQANLPRRQRENALVAPLFALLARGEKQYAFVVDATDPKRPVARLREVTYRGLQDRRAEVVSGLAAGELLVVRGQRLLEEGTPVTVARTVSAEAEPQP